MTIATIIMLSSCKTTSRSTSSSLSSGSQTTQSNLRRAEFRIGDELFEFLTIETVIELPTVILVNGEERVVNTTTTERQTAVRATKKDSSFASVDSSLRSSKDTTVIKDTLNRATEGMEVIPDIVEGLSKGIFGAIFGKAGQFVVVLILIIIAVILLRMAFRRKKNP
jgi:exoribonuclease R